MQSIDKIEVDGQQLLVMRRGRPRWLASTISACCLTGKCYPIASCGVLPNLFRSSISNQSHPGHPCGGEAVAQSPRPKAGEKSVAVGCCGSVIRLMSSWSLTGQFLLSPVAGL